MNSWKVILATLLIFGTGVVTGVLVGRHAAQLSAHRSDRGLRPNHPGAAGLAGGGRLEFLRRMQRDLDLTADQNQRVEKIISESQDRTRKLMEPVRAQLQEEVKKAKAEFLEVLTPEQRTRFDQLWKQQQRQREQHHYQGPR